MNVDQATTGSASSSQKAPSTPVLRLNIHQPFETFPAGWYMRRLFGPRLLTADTFALFCDTTLATAVDEYVAQEEGEDDFIKDVMQEMFDIMIWSECRPKAEIEQFANAMDDKLKLIEEKEQEQGMSLMERARQNLVAFVASIQTALAALTNF
ncbi:hypothetical protein FRC04_006729 [Tulasnella sp. 424]|nr:hypothetical protein FRC04_006729 [Tulasnella sp. 424]